MKMRGIAILSLGMALGAMTMATVVPNLDRKTKRKIDRMGKDIANRAEDLYYSLVYNRI